MSFAPDQTTCDDFLDGKLKFCQPKQGFRAAADAVFLAASVPVTAEQTVLELGCGVGVALGCLSFRVPGAVCFGIEIQPDYASAALENFATNDLQARIFAGNLLEMPQPLKEMGFDHVMSNPPFFSSAGNTAPNDDGRAVAHMANDVTIRDWVEISLRRLKPGGIMTMIHRTEALQDILTAIGKSAGDIRILPITSRQNRPARRVIVQARKTAHGPLVMLSPFIVHAGLSHEGDGDSYSEKARDILRHGAELRLDR